MNTQHRFLRCPIIGDMTLTLPDQPASSVENDRWGDVHAPPVLAHAGRVLTDDAPTIERPTPLTFERLILVVVTLATLAVSLLLGGKVGDDSVSDSSLRMLSLALALASFLAGAVFGLWAFRQRAVIDSLRWRSFRRSTWGGWWSVVWTITPAVALIAFSVVERLTDSLTWTSGVLLGLVAVRMISLRALGTNMKRVVLGARRWLKAGALATALADFLVVAVVWAALLEPQLDRDVLRIASSIVALCALLAAGFVLSYAKRVERWVLEWWENRWGCTPQVVVEELGAAGFSGAAPDRFAGRRLLPTAPLRLLVVGSYIAFAATTAWSGWTVWSLSEGLENSEGLTASVGRLDAVSLWFFGALVLTQACHAVWCIAQAWNARRCTLGAPSALGMAALFLFAPAIAGVGVVVVNDDALLALVASFAVVVNLACWALSFSLLDRVLQSLGRPTRHIATWASAIALHWVLVFGVRSIVLVDDSAVFAGLILAVAIVDAAIFLRAAVYAHLAMRHVEQATSNFEQIRRRPVSRQRRRHRARRRYGPAVTSVR